MSESNGALPPIKRYTFRELSEAYPTMRPPVIDGICRKGETVNIISASKIGKSWLVYALVLCIIAGRRWLDRYATSHGRVLLIDNELHKDTLANRIPRVADALGISDTTYQDALEVWSLRGDLRSLEELADELAKVEPGTYQAVIIDAKYRAMAIGESENDNRAEAEFYNQLDWIAERLQAAFILVHHSSKGNQGEKRVTDVGAGAGAQSRAADCHLVLREHEEDGKTVLDAAVRSFPPVEPVVLTWDFPLWVPDENGDPTKLRGKQTANERRTQERDRQGQDEILASIREEGPATVSKMRRRTGFSKDRCEKLMWVLQRDGKLRTEPTVTHGGHATEEYHLEESSDVPF